MATTLVQFDTAISLKLTPQGSGDLVTSQEIRDVMAIARTLFKERGVLIVLATSDFANTPSTESSVALVESQGFFIYKSTGVPDNVDIFPAQNGGVWKRVIGVSSSPVLGADLTDIEALAPSNDNILQRKAGHWVDRTLAQLKTDLQLNNVPNTDATNPSNIVENSTHRFVTDAEKTTWNGKQDSLPSPVAQATKVLTSNGTTWVLSVPSSVSVDSAPTQNSPNAVSSDGVYQGLFAKAPLVSPALTGTPTAPTAALNDNSTKLATTAWVNNQLDSEALYFTNNDFGGAGNQGSPMSVNASNVIDKIGNTRGAVLYRGAAGWAVLAPGTSGQVFQTQGAGADPIWANGGAGSSTVDVLVSQSVTNVASIMIDLTSFLSAYRRFEIVFEGVPVTNNVSLQGQISTDGTNPLTASNYIYMFHYLTYSSEGRAGNTAQPQWTIFDQLSNASNAHCSFRLNITNPNRAGVRAQGSYAGMKEENGALFVEVNGGLVYTGSTVWGGLKLFMSSGNIASGVYQVIGYKN